MTQQTALVSFAAPTNTGGSPITSYTVTANPGGIVAIGNISPILVTGLSSGVSYSFTVTATNAAGTSLPSTNSPVVGVEIDPYYVNVSTLLHNHVITDVQNLQATLDAKANSVHIHTTANITGLDATLVNLAAQIAASGASGGGADKVFYENDAAVTTNYSITSGKNAMSAGPITIADGVTVTVPNSSVWSVI